MNTVWNQKKIGLLTLRNCEAASLTVFTTMCPKEQQTSDNLIVKDHCFIMEMFDQFSFSGTLTGYLRVIFCKNHTESPYLWFKGLQNLLKV